MENEELECFAAAFRISPYIVFEVRYNHVGNNQEADFATLAEVLNRRKSDILNADNVKTVCYQKVHQH